MKFIRWLVTCTVLISIAAAGSNAYAQESGRAPLAGSCGASIPHASGAAGGLVSAGNGFGFRLYANLAGTDNSSNVFISPASIALALDMAYDGAQRTTKQGMAKALGLRSMKQDAVRRQAAALLSTLQQTGDPNAQLEVANSLWGRAGVSFRQAFLQDVRTSYDAKVSSLDFSSPNAVSTINSWVSCATHGTISSIIDRIPSQVILYLINAVYFEGQWASQFKPANTHARTFTTGAGTQTQVPLMDQTATFPYYQGSDFQAIALPYSKGRFQMDVILPRAGTSLQNFRSRLTPANWRSWTAGLRPVYGQLAFPRFTLTNSLMLNQPLETMGMSQAFSQTANFLGMCTKPCRLSDVRHKTYLKVDEHGTVASGATSVGVEPTAVQPVQFEMTVNRPFFLAIRDSQTGALLFFGGINNPAG